MVAKAYMWDTCVLYRYLGTATTDYVDHIEKYLEDLDAGRCEIYVSTISYAEIRASKVARLGLTPIQIVSSINKSLIPVSPSVDIMAVASHLRDQRYRQIDGPEERAANRELSLGDAIHLATGVALREEFGVQNLAFHTFDEGKRRDGETGKKTVPIIGFEKWCRDCADDEEIRKVIEMKRAKPVHISCPLPLKSKTTSSAKPPAS